jgi:hypothetical protein
LEVALAIRALAVQYRSDGLGDEVASRTIEWDERSRTVSAS